MRTVQTTGHRVSEISRILSTVATTHAHRAEKGKATRTILRLKVDGRDQGRLRYRSVVEEDDRIKLYGARTFLLESIIASVTEMKSDAGRPFGARVATTDGQIIEITTAPGMRIRRR